MYTCISRLQLLYPSKHLKKSTSKTGDFQIFHFLASVRYYDAGIPQYRQHIVLYLYDTSVSMCEICVPIVSGHHRLDIHIFFLRLKMVDIMKLAVIPTILLHYSFCIVVF